MTKVTYLLGTTLACSLSSLSAQLMNPGFEQGLTGWRTSVHAPGEYFLVVDEGPDEPIAYPFDETTNPWIAHLGQSIHVVGTGYFNTNPLHGSRMLGIETLGGNMTTPMEFIGPDGKRYSWVRNGGYSIALSQTVSLVSGDELSGSARWYSDDRFDSLQVTINGSPILSLNAGDLDGSPISDWRDWNWAAPSDGHFTVRLVVFGDGEDPSTGYFDSIGVPEGWANWASAHVLGLTVVGMGMIQRRNSSRSIRANSSSS